jgi:hypothetical protein
MKRHKSTTSVTHSVRAPSVQRHPKLFHYVIRFFLIAVILWVNFYLYVYVTKERKINIQTRLSGELRKAVFKSVLFWLMAIECTIIFLYFWFGLVQCLKCCKSCFKWCTLITAFLSIFWYVSLTSEMSTFQNSMETLNLGQDSGGSICRFPTYFPGWLFPPVVLPLIQGWLKYHLNQPFFEPTAPTFAMLRSSGSLLKLTFQGCLEPSQSRSYIVHPATVLLSTKDIPPIGSGLGDFEEGVTGMDGLAASLQGKATITKEEGQAYNYSFSKSLREGENSILLVDKDSKDSEPPIGLVQAFCSDKKSGKIEEQVIPHVPELERLRKTVQKNTISPPSCPFSLTVVLIDSVSLRKAMSVWPKFWAELERINEDSSYKNKAGGTLRSSTHSTTPPPSSKHTSTVFNFARYHALGRFKSKTVATGYNVRPLFTGRLARGPGPPPKKLPHHRPKTETTAFWEELRVATGHASWWANGMCFNYGLYIDRARMWSDVEFLSVGCHLDYDQGGTGNYVGPYSLFSRYVGKVPVHRHLLSYPKLWRKKYGPASKLPTVGVINLLEAHEGLGQVVKTMDQDLVNLLHEMRNSGALEDTMVVFLSDHGSDMGLKELWSESWIEKIHPFLTMIVPDAMLARIGPKAHATLNKNTQRLVTAYDIHRTFLSMCSKSGGVDSSNGRQTFVPAKNHSDRPPHADGPYSLLHEEIPVGRTCEDALVPDTICECK